MSYSIYKEMYSERRAYRFRVTDEAEQVCYLAEPTGAFLPNPTRLITLFDADHVLVGRIEPPPLSAEQWGGDYTLFLGEDEQPTTVIEEQWSVVDRILLRLPRYTFNLGPRAYAAQGSRYGERLYQIYLLSGEGEGEPETETLEEGEGVTLEEDLDEDGLREALARAARDLWGEPVGEITRPARGPSYVVTAEATQLRQAPLVLAALTIIVDMHLHPPDV